MKNEYGIAEGGERWRNPSAIYYRAWRLSPNGKAPGTQTQANSVKPDDIAEH
jgi:hypothetical protein